MNLPLPVHSFLPTVLVRCPVSIPPRAAFGTSFPYLTLLVEIHLLPRFSKLETRTHPATL